MSFLWKLNKWLIIHFIYAVFSIVLCLAFCPFPRPSLWNRDQGPLWAHPGFHMAGSSRVPLSCSMSSTNLLSEVVQVVLRKSMSLPLHSTHPQQWGHSWWPFQDPKPSPITPKRLLLLLGLSHIISLAHSCTLRSQLGQETYASNHNGEWEHPEQQLQYGHEQIASHFRGLASL